MNDKVPIVVVIGVGRDGKPHASRFLDSDLTFVARAADLMRFHVIEVLPDNEELHGLAEKLPRGRIFSTGRGFVPFINRAAFDKLATLVEGGVTSRASDAEPSEPLAAIDDTEAVDTANALWSNVEVGTVVLATQPELYGPTWWEGVVVAVDGDDLTLRWIEDPTQPSFNASRRNVALRHPGAD